MVDTQLHIHRRRKVPSWPPGPYNVIKNWNYTALVDSIHSGEGNCWMTKVQCEEEFIAAIKMATEDNEDCLCLQKLF
ncbi:hypothetical protein M0R45_018919 [Rubus argutus]|uniref:Uncharacterized protein n=1 Tax=Rubus argutus TaxID=59490 RepID=A0AAW1X6H7_RUBAR